MFSILYKLVNPMCDAFPFSSSSIHEYEYCMRRNGMKHTWVNPCNYKNFTSWTTPAKLPKFDVMAQRSEVDYMDLEAIWRLGSMYNGSTH